MSGKNKEPRKKVVKKTSQNGGKTSTVNKHNTHKAYARQGR